MQIGDIDQPTGEMSAMSPDVRTGYGSGTNFVTQNVHWLHTFDSRIFPDILSQLCILLCSEMDAACLYSLAKKGLAAEWKCENGFERSDSAAGRIKAISFSGASGLQFQPSDADSISPHTLGLFRLMQPLILITNFIIFTSLMPK